MAKRYTGMTRSGTPPKNPLLEAAREGAARRRPRRSMRDMLASAERIQGEEAMESKKKGGKVMKKYAVGGTTTGTNPNAAAIVNTVKTNNSAAQAAQQKAQYDRREASFGDRTKAMAARVAAAPADQRARMQAKATDMGAKFAGKLTDMRSRMAPPSGTTENKPSSVAEAPPAAKKGGMMKTKKYAKGGGIEKRGKTKGMMPKMAGGKGYAKGGSVDGCAVRGKTRAPMRGK